MIKSIKTTVIAAILMSSAVIAFAQKNISEGTLTYGMVYELSPEQSSLASQLPPETICKFNDSMISIETERGPAKITILADGLTKSGLILVDIPIMQKQYAVKTNKEQREQTMGPTPKLSDFKATGEKQKTGTFDTERYTYKDDKGVAHELWATTSLILPEGVVAEEFKELKATPVKYTRLQNGIKTTVTLKEINEEKVGPISLGIPSGYEVTTMEALMSLGGGQ